ncbi:helix-turn-helix transcriptional regulator [Beijerinckia sp. L45]|uniref:helix-turn-helix transcriptional regulator n=1 Tax=Beijerinckia sp. L45 TaxID=1641855 RepID=UPI00131CFDE2|nr:helix-turn-helix transcriptional regulator [Beijerinckia sp. L45]
MPDRLYERAGLASDHPAPLWHLDSAHTFFAGPLDYNAAHRHGAPVYLAGLYGRFGLRIAGGSWLTCRTAMIPAGVVHELDLGGNPLAVFYVEASAGDAAGLAPLVADAEEVGGALVGASGEVAALRALFESSTGAAWAGEALADLLRFATARARRPIDPRLARALDLMDTRDADFPPLAASRCASAAGLSASRFQHLFTAQMGIPFRRYRGWVRMRRAIRAVVEGANFTTAAHDAGFADQAHFAHAFRQTFGAPASKSLTGIRR